MCLVLKTQKESPQSAPSDAGRYTFFTGQICLVVSHIKESYNGESYKRVMPKRHTNESYVRTFKTDNRQDLCWRETQTRSSWLESRAKPALDSFLAPLVCIRYGLVGLAVCVCWFVLLNRYWGIVTVLGFLRERAKGGRKGRSTSSPCLLSDNLWRLYTQTKKQKNKVLRG